MAEEQERQEEIAEIKAKIEKVFRAADTNNDGHITIEEVLKFNALNGDPASEEEVREKLLELDDDKDGKVTLEEM